MPTAHHDCPTAEPPGGWPRYGRPLEELSFSARSRRLKDPALHPIVDGLQRKVCAVCCAAKPLATYRQRRDGVFGHGS